MSRLIVSFTSYPDRIDCVKQVLDSLYAQTLPADEIVLWLAEDDFPNKETDLPLSLQQDLSEHRFTLRWCDDLGSHKKYFYAMQEYPEDIIVTVDDDLAYAPRTLERLHRSYLKHPKAVSSCRVSLILFDENGELLPCSRWVLPYEVHKDAPSHQLMAIGSRGTLYPPGLFDEGAFDKDTIARSCRFGDTIFFNDSWLKIQELIRDIPVVFVGECYENVIIPKAQNVALKRSREKAKAMGKKEYGLWVKMQSDGPIAPRLQAALSSLKEDASFVSLEEDAVLENVACKLSGLLEQEDLSESRINPVINFSMMELNRQRTIGVSSEKWGRYINIYRDILCRFPQAKRLTLSNLSFYALRDYGHILRTGLYGEKFTGPDQYERMLASWEAFLAEYPKCEGLYRKGYAKFISNMNGTISGSSVQRFLFNLFRKIRADKR